MVLYTTMPLEEVLRAPETDIKKGGYLQIPYSKGYIEVMLTSASTAKIVRLLSNELDDYLHPKLQPGTEIQLKWTEPQ